MPFQGGFAAFFRDIFVFHSGSLEFRARVLVAMLLGLGEIREDDWADLADIAAEIYGGDIRRQKILLQTIKEMLKKNSTADLDRLLIEISSDIKHHPRFAKKIDFSHLRRLMADSGDDEALLQQRIYEFLLSEVKNSG